MRCCLPTLVRTKHSPPKTSEQDLAENNMYTTRPCEANTPVYKTFTGRQFIHGGGVAIFHVKSARVVVVHHTKEGHWFLPKGRKDVGESSVEGAEREGFEESGFRNRVLPLPHTTVQTWDPQRRSHPHPSARFHTEPIATDLCVMGRREPLIQYICSWYVAETLPPNLQKPTQDAQQEHQLPPAPRQAPVVETPRHNPYQRPPPSPREETLEARMAMEPEGWEPQRVERSTTQSDELFYRAELLGIEEALAKLAGTGLEYVVVEGWRSVQERLRLEKEWAAEVVGNKEEGKI